MTGNTSKRLDARTAGEVDRAKQFVTDTTRWVQATSGERFLEHVTACLPVAGVRPAGRRWTVWVYGERAPGRFATAGAAMARVENLYAVRLWERHRALRKKGG